VVPAKSCLAYPATAGRLKRKNGNAAKPLTWRRYLVALRRLGLRLLSVRLHHQRKDIVAQDAFRKLSRSGRRLPSAARARQADRGLMAGRSPCRPARNVDPHLGRARQPERPIPRWVNQMASPRGMEHLIYILDQIVIRLLPTSCHCRQVCLDDPQCVSDLRKTKRAFSTAVERQSQSKGIWERQPLLLPAYGGADINIIKPQR
jgi:hypothetical protein